MAEGRYRITLWTLLLAMTGIGGCLGFFAAMGAFTPPPSVGYLPASATNRQSHSELYLPDFTRYEKSQMPEADFLPYVERLGMRPTKFEDRCMGWGPNPSIPWWNPSASDVGSYFLKDGDVTLQAKYENGHVFVLIWSI